MANVYLKTGDEDKALKILASVEKVSMLGQFVVWKMIRNALVKDNSVLAWDLFDGLRSKVLPAPEICSTIMMNCGKHDLIEKAFKTYRELQAQGHEPHYLTHSALIYVACKRKEYYARAIELFRQMEANRMNIDIRVYNNLLLGTAKSGDLTTALELWNRLQESTDEKLKINSITIANMLWSLASVETPTDKISKRPFKYDMNPEELRTTAKDIYNLDVKTDAYTVNAYLAVLANHNFIEEAEQVFWTHFTANGVVHNPSTYEIMLKMYDFKQDFEKTVELMTKAEASKIVLGFESWRAAIRTAALTTNLPTAIDWLKKMVAAGYKPSIENLKVLHLRLCENEKWQLRKEMGDLCLPPIVEPKNPYTTWRKRSLAVAELLKRVYGKDAPKLATKEN